MPSIFSRIVAGEIPCAKVWEDERFLAFLDIQPIVPGHTLLVPKREVDYLFALDPQTYGALMQACRPVAAAIQAATGCQRVCLGVFGFEVPHVHVHLIPTNSPNDFPFPPRQQAQPEALRELAARIASRLK